MGRPILCLDFDGVLHSYESGWKGAAEIPDLPVDGAIAFLLQAMGRFTVCIYSSRSHQWGGKRAMRRWLQNHIMREMADTLFRQKPLWLRELVTAEYDNAAPYDLNLRELAAVVVKRIEFPKFKPPALVTLDDRAIQFKGDFPDLDEIEEFKPWNKKP